MLYFKKYLLQGGQDMGKAEEKNVVEVINIANISTISFSGANKEKVRKKKENAKKKALNLSGQILRDIEFKDGFFLEVLFTEAETKEAWETSIK